MANVQKTVALVFGVVFLLVGVLGFIPALTPGGALLGIFMVMGVHNVVHLLFGVFGIAAALSGTAAVVYNRAGGVIYLVLGILGFIPALTIGGMLLGLVMINLADNILHVVIGLVLAYVGFAIESQRVIPARS